MPGEIVEPENPPRYLEHVDDPTHPAGNKELARKMARAEESDRASAIDNWKFSKQQRKFGNQRVAENAQLDAEVHDFRADKKGELARNRYLEAHPELTEGQEEMARETGDTVLGAVGVADPAEQEGKDAEGNKEDPELNTRIAEATAAQNTMIDNLRQLGVDNLDISGAIEKLESKRQELVEEERKRYEAEQEAERAAAEEAENQRLEEIEKIKSRVVDQITHIVTKDIYGPGGLAREDGVSFQALEFVVPVGSTDIFEKDEGLSRPLEESTHDLFDHPIFAKFRPDEVSAVINLVYGLLGAQRSSVEASEMQISGSYQESGGPKTISEYSNTSKAQANIPGLSVFEDRRYKLENPLTEEEAEKLDKSSLPLSSHRVGIRYQPLQTEEAEVLTQAA